MRALILSLALLVALLASGCATVKGVPVAADAPAPSLPATTSPPEPEPESEPVTNERGFIPAELGDELCFGPIDSDTCEGGVTFSVDKIVVDPPCMEFGQRTGHTLVVSMRVATGTDTDSIQLASGVFNPFSFIVIGKNGVSQDADFGMHRPHRQPRHVWPEPEVRVQDRAGRAGGARCARAAAGHRRAGRRRRLGVAVLTRPSTSGQPDRVIALGAR